MGINYFDVQELKDIEIARYSSCISDIDWVFGSNLKDSKAHGLPASAITLCGGEAGVGKTRIWAEICYQMSIEGFKVLYIQLEMPLFAFKSNFLKNKKLLSGYFFCSVERDIDDICTIIKKIKPHLVVIDSVNKINDFRSGRNASKIQDKLRNTINYIGSHVVLLSQLNQDKTVKGGTELPHMGDIVLKIIRNVDYGCVEVVIGKTRYGETGRNALFRHKDDGVECITENWRRSPDSKEIYFKGQGTMTDMVTRILKAHEND